MTVATKKSPFWFDYEISDKVIKWMMVEYLSVTVTHNLSWCEHVNICDKAQQKLNAGT